MDMDIDMDMMIGINFSLVTESSTRIRSRSSQQYLQSKNDTTKQAAKGCLFYSVIWKTQFGSPSGLSFVHTLS